MSDKAARAADYLGHILQALERIDRYTADMGESQFLGSEITQDAVIRNFEIIGEASRELRWQWEQIEASLAVIEELFAPVAPLTTIIHTRAVALARDHELAVYDALIVAAAQEAGCEILFSENLQHGQQFGTLTVENPFRREAA